MLRSLIFNLKHTFNIQTGTVVITRTDGLCMLIISISTRGQLDHFGFKLFGINESSRALLFFMSAQNQIFNNCKTNVEPVLESMRELRLLLCSLAPLSISKGQMSKNGK